MASNTDPTTRKGKAIIFPSKSNVQLKIPPQDSDSVSLVVVSLVTVTSLDSAYSLLEGREEVTVVSSVFTVWEEQAL